MKIIYKDQETIASFSMLPVLLSSMPLLFNEFIVYQLIGLIGGSSDVILGWMNRLVGWWMDGWAWLVALGSWLWVGVGGLVDGWFWMVGCMDVCMDGQTDELVLDWWMDG